MGAPPAAPPLLPVAPDRAVVANRIALLFSKQSALAKSLHRPPTSSSSSSRRAAPAPARDDDDDEEGQEQEDLAAAANPNAGAGYLPPKSPAAGAAEEKSASGQQRDRALLRNRLLGARGRKRDGAGGGWAADLNNGKKAALCESESDDEQGRSALGKRKRLVRDVAPKTAAESNRAGSEGEVQQRTPDAARDQEAEDESHRHVAEGRGERKGKKRKNRASESL